MDDINTILDMRVGELLGTILFACASIVLAAGIWGWKKRSEWTNKESGVFAAAVVYFILLLMVIILRAIWK